MKSTSLPMDIDLGDSWWARRQQQMLAKVLAPLANAQTGILQLTLPNGSEIAFGQHSDERLRPALKLNNWQAIRKAFTGGSVGWAEAYMDGDWDSPDLAILVEWVASNEAHISGALDSGRTQSLLQKWQHRRNANNKRGSRRNIAYHYDLGNDFYQHWLDSTMTYSSALYRGNGETLEQAQQQKYQRMIDQLAIADGASVLEIGCGWGGFAEQLCQQRRVSLLGITLSSEQLAFARRRISAAGLTTQASFELIDYRDCQGQYDHIVSIEMMEAVGEKYWPTYFNTLRQRLKPGGSAALQVITIDPARFREYSDNPDFIQTYIFPGGMLPSPEIFRRLANDAGLSVTSEYAFGRDYADTLADWKQRFGERWDKICELGFDGRFKRMWDYYLGYCEGGFRAGSIDVYQFTLHKAD